ncbi:MAG TPA: SRPBCC family protein [Solirubrobacteraceae bacterium]|nr:SRPBCC family protein [Solirubrobacteraceae bacterium]
MTTVLNAPQAQVFEYLADVEHLPEWATEFARELKREGDDYKVVNGLGEFFFEIRADRASGVIDMLAGPTKRDMAVFPTRAVALPDGRTAYSFTMFQGPGMTDELFEAQHASLRREFANIERLLDRSSAVNPAARGSA